MRKKSILLSFIICMFMFIGSVNAESSITCTPTNAYIGDQITCSIKTDEPVEVSSKLDVVAGDTTLTKDGNIVYKASAEGTYDIIIKTIDPGYTNTIKVQVRAQTTTTRTTTTTTKAKSDNNYLSTITINGEEIDDFSRGASKYFVEVENDVTKVTLNAKAEDENAKVEIDGPSSLQVGDNEYTISVTSENDTTKFYKVIVTRLDEEESSNTRIKNIKIKGYRFNFDRNSKTFYLNIDKEDTELDIMVTLSDDSSSYEIEGNENLEDGSVIKIIVTAEDGNTDTYRIIIEKKDTNYVPFIIAGIIILIIVGLVIFFVIRKNKKKKEEGKKTKEKEARSKKTPNKPEVKEKDYQEEKTIEMPAISGESTESDVTSEDLPEDEDDFDVPLIDNDEEEETRILSYAEREELERTKALNDDDIGSVIDEELEKKLSSNDDDEEEYY